MKRIILSSIVAFAIIFSIAKGCQYNTTRPLITVRIESKFTTDEYKRNWTFNTPFPHCIATRLDTGERVRISGDTWGNVGEVITISPAVLITY